ncbi:CDP-alcohol phosphatidyltransferase family protein [Amnibacterium flavum]|uniref:CDP-alcohol phosphatidyltransferase n=1 Tax=Amnibacterium flavum TaxID=2173173 RepID=A0A2V1HTJ6_9MICO|nr:CDP-alcohol phosphatidyltransferase family protein [Amnibacterium flavum]PVZ95893.1 CDP-alcohol phosphatidyltransferase [Amnibacterium flavum]
MSTVTDSLRALGAAQKSSKGVSLYSRYINRPFGRVLAALAHSAGLTPNAVTAVSAIVTAGGIAVLALVPPTWWSGILVAALLVVGFALDSADGQVARLRGGGSAAGEWLDHVVDAGKMVALHAAVLIGFARFTDLDAAALLVPLGYQFVAVVMFAGGTLALVLKHKAPAGAPAAAPSTVRAVGLLPADYGVLAFSFVFWGIPALYFVLYTILFIVNALIGAALLVKAFRELSRQ